MDLAYFFPLDFTLLEIFFWISNFDFPSLMKKSDFLKSRELFFFLLFRKLYFDWLEPRHCNKDIYGLFMFFNVFDRFPFMKSHWILGKLFQTKNLMNRNYFITSIFSENKYIRIYTSSIPKWRKYVSFSICVKKYFSKSNSNWIYQWY